MNIREIAWVGTSYGTMGCLKGERFGRAWTFNLTLSLVKYDGVACPNVEADCRIHLTGVGSLEWRTGSATPEETTVKAGREADAALVALEQFESGARR